MIHFRACQRLEFPTRSCARHQDATVPQTGGTAPFPLLTVSICRFSRGTYQVFVGTFQFLYIGHEGTLEKKTYTRSNPRLFRRAVRSDSDSDLFGTVISLLHDADSRTPIGGLEGSVLLCSWNDDHTGERMRSPTLIYYRFAAVTIIH